VQQDPTATASDYGCDFSARALNGAALPAFYVSRLHSDQAAEGQAKRR